MQPTPCLPQNDPKPSERESALAKAKDEYQFSYSYQNVVAAAELPLREKTDPAYWEAILSVTAKLEQNKIASQSQKENVASAAKAVGSVLEKILPHQVADMRKSRSQDVPPYEGEHSIDAYKKMYATIPLPGIADVWQQDDIFAWQAIAGCNPMMLQCLKQPLAKFPITNEHFQKAVGEGDTLEAAMKEGRLFISDYVALDGLPEGSVNGLKKYNFAPIAAYCWQKFPSGGGNLVPVAIQCTQAPVKGVPIFTPADGESWMMARTVVSAADGNFQGIISHFSWCHEVMESVVLSSHRTLAPNHPLFLLLSPHFANTLITNDISMTALIGPDGYMDRLQSPTLEASLATSCKSIADFRLSESAPGKDFGSKGTNDLATLGEYPFRDDCNLLWPHVEAWTRDYLRLYYHSDTDIQQDGELKAWAAELGSREGGRLNGIELPQTVDELIDLVAQIIFRCTVYHAAVNYSSFALYSYAPNMQAAAFGPGPTGGPEDTPEARLRMLPPYDVAYQGFYLFYELQSIRLNRMGYYPDNQFRDERVAEILERFYKSLDEAEKIIDDRNETRKLDYSFLRPSRIANSIHV